MHRSNKLFKHSWSTRMKRLALVLALLLVTVIVITICVFVVPRGASNLQSTCHHSQNDSSPFSCSDPVDDVGLYSYLRPNSSSPPPIFRNHNPGEPLPTNSWYQNMLLLQDGEPTFLQQVYAIPYVLDTIGPIPGLRVHPIYLDAMPTEVQVEKKEEYGLTLGIARDASNTTYQHLTHRYSVLSTSDLGLTLEWDAFPMQSSIVRGMPYATMIYEIPPQHDDKSNTMFPTFLSEIRLRGQPLVDNSESVRCDSDHSSTFLVQKELQLTFEESDFTWLVFFSEPVHIQCYIQETSDAVLFQVKQSNYAYDGTTSLIVRVAVADPCTTHANSEYCSHRSDGSEDSLAQQYYAGLLRRYSPFYPGPRSNAKFQVDHERNTALLTLDFDPQTMSSTTDNSSSRVDHVLYNETELIMFALPHHLDSLDPSAFPKGSRYCTQALTGPACLVTGSLWTLVESLPRTSLRAARHPQPRLVPNLAEALRQDINFVVPEYVARGAGDTYFSGKMLAKHGRILLIAEELAAICGDPYRGSSSILLRQGSSQREKDKKEETNPNEINKDYAEVCQSIQLPTSEDFSKSLDTFRDAVEAWIGETAEAIFVYDEKWGGLVNCGCVFDQEGRSCTNEAPECPDLHDYLLNFGNGFYNDHHFHYGYHIYAAAVVAHFDPSWGRTNFERILMFIRDIANPSIDDPYFPIVRHKDWYLGSSWASGISLPPFHNGPNQESSSEAIAAYESVAIFGNVMALAWEESGDVERASVAKNVRNVGRLLAATELRSAKRYWHVHHNDKSLQVYPPVYQPAVVGNFWGAMIQEGTWFGHAPYHSYGIQLLPLTAIAEERDDSRWLQEMYPLFSASCSSDPLCEETGWSVLQWAMLAAMGGDEDVATDQVLRIDSEAFRQPGGNGHSLTNTLWYIATRPRNIGSENPYVEVTYDEDPSDGTANNGPPNGGEGLNYDDETPNDNHQTDTETLNNDEGPTTTHDETLTGELSVGQNDDEESLFVLSTVDCGRPESCYEDILMRIAGSSFSCLDRILWLMNSEGATERDACAQIAGIEYPYECGPCNPDPATETVALAQNPTRTPTRTPTRSPAQYPTRNPTRSPTPNPTRNPTQNPTQNPTSQCPPCSAAQCGSGLNNCPLGPQPYYICTDGGNYGGCSLEPWTLDDMHCRACCSLSSCSR